MINMEFHLSLVTKRTSEQYNEIFDYIELKLRTTIEFVDSFGLVHNASTMHVNSYVLFIEDWCKMDHLCRLLLLENKHLP
jgi:hypothetical protein